MSDFNPLQKYFRQPKIYISLPSRGLYYAPGSFQGDYNTVPIMAMTGLDEIVMRTPDALFNGEAAYKVIESCCPYIKDAKSIPSIDVDTILMAIKIATFGPTLRIEQTCPHCQHENEYELDLNILIEHFKTQRFVNHLDIDQNLSMKIRPLTFEQTNYFGVENFKLQKTAFQAQDIQDEDAKTNTVNQIFSDLSELQLTLLLASIESVQVDNTTVTDQTHIITWLKNMEREIFDLIKNKLEENKNNWSAPEQEVQCGNCQTASTVKPVLDQSNFFV